MTARERQQYINTAKELGYGPTTIERLEKALNDWEADRILHDARGKEKRIWNR